MDQKNGILVHVLYTPASSKYSDMYRIISPESWWLAEAGKLMATEATICTCMPKT